MFVSKVRCLQLQIEIRDQVFGYLVACQRTKKLTYHFSPLIDPGCRKHIVRESSPPSSWRFQGRELEPDEI